MKILNKGVLFLFFLTLCVWNSACNDDDENGPQTYDTEDQMARPGINTVFTESGRKNEFNTTVPSEMGDEFAEAFEERLLELNPNYNTNILQLNSEQFAGVLATDVLTVNTAAPSSFAALNGRALDDDVIDVVLTLIFGGPTGTDNPDLSSDNVDENDKAFLNEFPYLAEPHL